MSETPEHLVILAGTGDLVPEVSEAAREHAKRVSILSLVARDDLGPVEHGSLEDLPGVLAKLAALAPTHVCAVGALHISHTQRMDIADASDGARDASDLAGSANVMGLATKLGFALVGAHQIAPELLAGNGLIAGPENSLPLHGAAAAAIEAARNAGRLDLGQAVVWVGGRVVAAEDISGTSGLLVRIERYSDEGLLPSPEIAPRLMAKALKPGQPAVLDMPAIGPDTIDQAAAAGVTAIVLEAARCLIIQRKVVAERAERLGIAILGVTADE
ncbi:UDP-2,3-diacylglucosamine diphosphatase LpxI domain-containing protein [Cucumibacter marinus]|uniref:UDP-2,3-diacylglucosamine diphosphatase LpxI domain-containing protein n=1 Tax=Cucumibacter marinus TaxID=1121252 RepID=UPI0004191917|nr:UDP-2,3-diacylglucosamine diphosphatase LpxI [Cucumibacter marinus]